MSSSNKIKQSTSVISSVASRDVTTVDPAGRNSDAFDQIFSQTAAAQSASDRSEDSHSQNQSSDKKDQDVKIAKTNSKQVSAKDDNSSTQDSSGSKEISPEEQEIAEAERRELQQIEDDRASLAAVEKQIENLLLSQSASQQVVPVQQAALPNQQALLTQQQQNTAITLKIDSKILRRVDVKTLDERLKKLTDNQSDLLKLSPQQVDETSLETGDTAIEGIAAPVEQQVTEQSLTPAAVLPESQKKTEESDSEKTPVEILQPAELQKAVDKMKLSQDHDAKQENASDQGKDFNIDWRAKVSKIAKTMNPDDAAATGLWKVSKDNSQLSTSSILNSFNLAKTDAVQTSSAQAVVPPTVATATMSQVPDTAGIVVSQLAKDSDSQVARIQISPENLGKIEVRVEVKDNKVTAEFVTNNASAKHLLDRHAPEIKQILANENMNLEHFSSRHDGQYFADQAADKNVGSGSRQSSQNQQNSSESNDEVILHNEIRAAVRQNSLIDITV